MAIQHRRGSYTNFDPQKMKAGEFAVVQSNDPIADDGEAVYIAFQAGTVKRLATHDEMQDNNAEAQAILESTQEAATTATESARNASIKASEAGVSAQSAQNAQTATENLLADAQQSISQARETSLEAITEAKESAVAEAQSSINETYEAAIESIDETYQDRVDEINEKVDQMIAVKTEAENIATSALNKANALENEISEVGSKTDRNTSNLNNLSFDVDSMIHGWYVDVQKRLIFTDVDGNPIGDPIEGIGGSGGGGGGSTTNAEMSATNTTGWISNSVAVGDTVRVKILWTSIENDLPTGNGVATIRVNSIIKATYEIAQGEITFDLTNYLNSGTNNVKITITDIYDQARTLGFNVSVLDLRVTSTFNTAVPFDSSIPVPVTPYGDVEKTLYWEVDDNVVHTQNTSASGRQITYTIPAQSHGAHKLRLYFETVVNNQTVTSNILYYEFISLETMNNTPIIISSFNTTEVNQYSSVIIPYRVYTPTSDTTDVKLYLNNSLVSTQTVDRTEQSYTFRANTSGTNVFKVEAGSVSKSFTLNVIESDVNIEAEIEDLALYLTSQGRSNNEETRSVWTYEDISATLSDFNYRIDGWQNDSDGITVLRVNDDSRVTIPYKVFGSDFKTTGKTIEIEFATRDVSDYTAEIMSCFADNIGFKITPQSITFKGAQTEISTLYKENEHVRLSIVVEKQQENRLILIYINGVMSRAIQYASGERFSQLNPVGITIGSNDCGIDIYNIRIYDNNLTREQVLMNWIADTQIGSTMIDRFTHNNVYDASGNIPIANLPKDLPYMIISADELSQYKGDEKTVSIQFVDPIYSSKSFTATGVVLNVQGTSSSVYFRKNYDTKYKNGFNTASGTIDNYALRQNSIPFNRFVLKADVASSESTNNTGLTMFYNDTCPYKTPEMESDSRVRWGIEGIPIVLYWNDTSTDTVQFLGKYNFNLPKRAPAPYGYANDDTLESWEFERNNSDNVKFKDNDFTTMSWDEIKQQWYPEWYNDFEARFPSDEWRDYNKLNELISWVKSTDRTQATSVTFAEPIVYRLNTTITVSSFIGDTSYTVEDEVNEQGQTTGYKIFTFTKDTPAYRLTKFKAEFDQYFETDSAVFYYLFTEIFTMIDSRAKNMFIGFNGSAINDSNRAMTRKATIQPYDMDTAIGTNNSGILMFGYYHEDGDTVSSIISGGDSGGSEAPIFNAQDSVLWSNVRDSFRSELSAMYRQLRADGTWSYQAVETMYENHQAKWPEAVFNEDAYIKYLYPLVEAVTVDEETGNLIKTDRYLTMLQGSKQEQRKWWLYNRFRYMDSKYNTGTAASNTLDIRLFNSGTLTITPAVDMYVAVAFGLGSTPLMQRTTTNNAVSYTYTAPSGVTEMETSIYSGDMITDLGDLSVFYPNELNFAKGTKLKRLQIGSSASGYSNANLRTIDVSNSPLLEYIDCRNCPNLNITVNLENSSRLKEAYFDGTSVTGVDLADGAVIETLHLPSTITTLTLLNLNKLEELEIASYANISRLMLANIDQTILNPVAVLRAIQANSQVNIQGLYLELADATAIEEFLNLLDTMSGVTRERGANGEWLYYEYDTAVINGEVHTSQLTGAQIASYNERYPYLKVTADYVESTLTYKTYDGSSIIKTVTCLNGVPQESAPSVPSRANSSDGHYSYTGIGWNTEMDSQTADPSAIVDVIADRTVYAAYTWTVRTYTVYWQNAGSTIETDTNVAWGTIPHYDGSTPTSGGQTSTGWLPDPTQPITGNTTFVAQYLPVYTVTFKNDTGSTTLDTQSVVQGQTATYGGTTPTSSEDSSLTWLGWATSANSHTANATLTNVQSNMTVYAAFESAVEDIEITDSWDTIIASIDNGTYATKYKVGNYKPIDLGDTYGNAINMQITAIDSDELASGGTAPLTFVAKELLSQTSKMNSTGTNANGYPATNVMKPLLDNTIYPLIPSNIRERIQRVNKTYYDYTTASTLTSVEKLWIPSAREIFGGTSYENRGVMYTTLFKDATSRIKNRNGSAAYWWLRSAISGNASYFRDVSDYGGVYFGYAHSAYGVCIGFCLGLESETITDDWSTILSNTNYATDYSIGDTKMIDLGTEGKHLMEIVAINEDDKADGTGKAGLTWISKTLLNTTHRMNPSRTANTEGTGTLGGWEKCEMRTYLKETIKPLIPETVRNAIVPVTKISNAYQASDETAFQQTTTDDVWIPGHREIFNSTSYDQSGAVYNSKFTDATSRIKKMNGSANNWWLRSAYSSRYFRSVSNTGDDSFSNANNSYGVALGFCTNG